MNLVVFLDYFLVIVVDLVVILMVWLGVNETIITHAPKTIVHTPITMP